MDQHRRVTPQAVKEMLLDGQELTLIDLREELIFSERHLLFARSLPLSHLELRMVRLVPRRSTRIVLCDADDGLAERGAVILQRYGYTDVAILDGGIEAWAKAGFELFSGVNVPSKAFGEFVEHESGTPSISADELNALMQNGADMVVLDSRPFDEFHRVSIPTGINTPGAELVLRVKDLAPSPGTLVVVNCAGRTRSIIGAQSLIHAGVPNKVVALRNGTMGWSLAGLTCDHGKERKAPAPSGTAVAWAKSAAAGVAQRLGIDHIDQATLDRFRSESDQRSFYLFDVRDPPEYAAGHVAGAVSAPGGQLVQATDQYIGTLGARVVLVDDKEVRAVMTASWLRQMGCKDVYVFAGIGAETGWPEAPMLGELPEQDILLSAPELAGLLASGEATVLDLSLSRTYRAGHIPGAWFAIRARLGAALAKIPLKGTLVLTSEDGRLAGLAVSEAAALTALPVRVLAGGNAAWKAAGQPLTSDDPHMADDSVDAWLKPYERTGDTKKAAAEYLSWEVDLLPRIARDGTTNFVPFKQRALAPSTPIALPSRATSREAKTMGADRKEPIIHFVGSIPLPDAETVFRTLSEATGKHLARLPDGETGIRKTWIRFLQDVLAENPAVEVAHDVPPFKFVQWDGKVLREIPRLRVKPGMAPKAEDFKTGYADMAIESWSLFDRMQKAGAIPAGVKFQISLPTPVAPTYNNMVPDSRQKILPPLTQHFAGEVAKIAQALPNDRIAIQWDVCQEVLAWENYYDPGPVDFRTECLDMLAKVGDAVPEKIDLGYHLCYGSPADEHMVQPKDTGIMVEMTNGIVERVKRPIQFFHLPVPKPRTDDAYFAPLKNLKLKDGTDLYLGLIHHNDAEGDATRLAAARRYSRVDGVATECGMARGDPSRLPSLLAAHVRAAELAA